MSTTQFQKSPPTPADSELWKIGSKWRRSQKTGLDYTELDNIQSTHEEIDIQSLMEALDDQLSGKAKESIQYVGHFLVASQTQDGKVFVYGYPPNQKEQAEKKASYNGKGGSGSSVRQGQQQQQQSFSNNNRSPNLQSYASSGTAANTNKPSFAKQTLEVPYSMVPIAWDDEEKITKAEEKGLYPLPVKHVGVENWGYISEETGKRTFWYGKIKTIPLEE